MFGWLLAFLFCFLLLARFFRLWGLVVEFQIVQLAGFTFAGKLGNVSQCLLYLQLYFVQ